MNLRLPSLLLASTCLLGACSKAEEASTIESSPPPATEPAERAAVTPRPAPSAEGSSIFEAGVTDQSPTVGPAIGGGYVYWLRKADVGREGLGKDRVERRKLSGGERETVAGPASIFDLASDGERVYWLAKGGELFSLPHGGGEPQLIARFAGNPIRIVLGENYVLARGTDGLALARKEPGSKPELLTKDREMGRGSVIADGDRFFVLVGKAGTSPGKRVGTVTVFAPGTQPVELAASIENPGRLLGVHEGHLYLSAEGAMPVTPRLVRLDAAKGGTVEAIGDDAWGFGASVIVEGTLYGAMWIRNWGVYALPLSGGEPVPLGSFKDGMPEGFAATEDALFWVQVRDLHRAPRR